jgi:DNA-binding transcriptional LysR family regulator
MRLKHLQTFRVVAATLNFTRAGERLHLAQSSITEQIQALEADLGAALLDRSRRKLALTPAGARLLDYADHIIALADEARSVVRAEGCRIAGQIAIGAIESLCLERLPALVCRYCAAFPDVRVVLRPGKTVDLHGSLKAGLLDVYFTFGDPANEAGLRHEQLGREPIILIAPHPLAGRAQLSRDVLARERFILTIPGCPIRAAFERAFAANATRPKVVAEIASIAAMRRLVETGAGCALIPRAAVQPALLEGKVVALAWDGPQATTIAMTWRRRRTQPPALRYFLDAAREELAVA